MRRMEHLVTIREQVVGRRVIRECLNELPGRPGCGGMIRDVDMDELAAIMPEDDEPKDQAKSEGRDDEEVDGDGANCAGARQR